MACSYAKKLYARAISHGRLPFLSLPIILAPPVLVSFCSGHRFILPLFALLLFLSAEKLLDFLNKGIGQFWKIL